MVTVFGKIPSSVILGLDGDQLVYSVDGRSWLEFDEYTKAEVDALLQNKLDAGNVYTKAEVDALLSSVEAILANKIDASEVYTKSEVDSRLTNKADVSALPDMSAYYTSSVIDGKLSAKADTGVTDGLASRISDLENSLSGVEEELATI